MLFTTKTSKLLLVAVFALFLLTFGCLGGSQSTSSSTTPSAPSGSTTPTGSGSGTSDSTPPSPPSDTSGTAPSTPDNSLGDTPSNDFSGLTYTQLLGRNVPLECDIVSQTQAGTVTMKFFYDGNSKTRVEFQSPQTSGRDSCQRMAVIGQNRNSATMGCISGQPYIPNCDWLMIQFNQSDVDDVEQTYATPSGSPDYTSLPPTSYSCRPWIVDQTKFATPGRVCNFEDMMGGRMPSR